jgi:hypothetical protein
MKLRITTVESSCIVYVMAFHHDFFFVPSLFQTNDGRDFILAVYPRLESRRSHQPFFELPSILFLATKTTMVKHGRTKKRRAGRIGKVSTKVRRRQIYPPFSPFFYVGPRSCCSPAAVVG